MPDENWDQYKKLVIHELERTNHRLTDIDKRLGHIERRIAVLNTKVYASALIISLVLTGVFNIAFDIMKAN